jgi:hypothetical protein
MAKEQHTTQINSKRHKSLLKHPHKVRIIGPPEDRNPIKNPNGACSGAKQVSSTGLYAAAPLRSAPHKLLIRCTATKRRNLLEII